MIRQMRTHWSLEPEQTITQPSRARYAFHGDMEGWWLPMRFGVPPAKCRGRKVVSMLKAQSQRATAACWGGAPRARARRASSTDAAA